MSRATVVSLAILAGVVLPTPRREVPVFELHSARFAHLWKQTGRRGPSPPVGRHRYVHRPYALDAPPGDLHRPARAQLEHAMAGHVLGKAELIGTYARR